MNPQSVYLPTKLPRLLLCLMALCLVIGAGFNANAQSVNLLITFDTEDVGDPNPPPLSPGSPKSSGIIAQGRDGSLYGTTPGGGANGAGAIYRFTPSSGVMEVIYSFPTVSNIDPVNAPAGLTLGTDGNFYGASIGGGTSNLGTLFRVTPSGVLTTLHSFNGTDGAFPYAPPIEGRDGNFYGVTQQGGTNSGAAYKLNPRTMVLTRISTVPQIPEAPLTLATDGYFYGTAHSGGSHGFGMVFRMSATGVVKPIYNFNQSDGATPVGPVVQGIDGNLYGTTSAGGDANGDGVIFKMTTSGKILFRHLFNGADGSVPLGGLVQASDHNFYGVTSAGGAGFGTLYSVSPSGVFSPTPYNFDKPTTGTSPELTLVQHTSGPLYGDTVDGGTIIEENGGGPGGGQGTFYNANANTLLPAYISLVSTAGLVGTQVEVLGQGFLGSANVSFNGVPAASTVVSDTDLLATVPSGANTGQVTVVTSSSSLTSTKIFAVLPSITGFNPTSGKVGSSVVIGGGGLTNTTAVTIGGVKAPFSVNSASQVTATVPTGAKTGKIVIATRWGTATSSANFTVLP